MTRTTLLPSEYHNFYQIYIDQVDPALGIVEGLKTQHLVILNFYKQLPEDKHNYAYAKDKWTIKDVLLHIIDTERILAYRALRISRGDKTALAGFEQDDFVVHGKANERSMESLCAEYSAVRQASIALFSSFDDAANLRVGEASGFPISVRALGFIILGHENHHNRIIEERYL
ncbi:DinB family protein [Winogradskyella rapida]|uniref:DinB family protein n=1 Tax=Winogradskyella rapida TaxID=549701 RepID=A0ABW3KM29_9FLAO